MNVRDIMCPQVHSCHASDALDSAARIMWDHDCGSVPVVDEDNQVIGVITDRDICMAAYTQGLPLREIAVSSAMSHEVHACSALDTLEAATALMRTHRVRRVPVLDDHRRLAGILSLNDIALTALDNLTSDDSPIPAEDVVVLLGTVCEPRTGRHGHDGAPGAEQDGSRAHESQAAHAGPRGGREGHERGGKGRGESPRSGSSSERSAGAGGSYQAGGRGGGPSHQAQSSSRPRGT